jgi:hypothetical protein
MSMFILLLSVQSSTPLLLMRSVAGRACRGRYPVGRLAAGGGAAGRRGQNGGDLFVMGPSKAPSYPKSKGRDLPRFW